MQKKVWKKKIQSSFGLIVFLVIFLIMGIGMFIVRNDSVKKIDDSVSRAWSDLRYDNYKQILNKKLESNDNDKVITELKREIDNYLISPILKTVFNKFIHKKEVQSAPDIKQTPPTQKQTKLYYLFDINSVIEDFIKKASSSKTKNQNNSIYHFLAYYELTKSYDYILSFAANIDAQKEKVINKDDNNLNNEFTRFSTFSEYFAKFYSNPTQETTITQKGDKQKEKNTSEEVKILENWINPYFNVVTYVQVNHEINASDFVSDKIENLVQNINDPNEKAFLTQELKRINLNNEAVAQIKRKEEELKKLQNKKSQLEAFIKKQKDKYKGKLTESNAKRLKNLDASNNRKLISFLKDQIE